MKRALPLLAALLALGGCSREGPKLPEACRSGSDSFRRALAKAPGDVRVDGVALSSCLTPEADAAELQAVGAAFLATAVSLAGEARREPGGDGAVRLGYLIGAMRTGAKSSPGLHTELLRRVEQETGGLQGPSFARGERAGRERG